MQNSECTCFCIWGNISAYDPAHRNTPWLLKSCSWDIADLLRSCTAFPLCFCSVFSLPIPKALLYLSYPELPPFGRCSSSDTNLLKSSNSSRSRCLRRIKRAVKDTPRYSAILRIISLQLSVMILSP